MKLFSTESSDNYVKMSGSWAAAWTEVMDEISQFCPNIGDIMSYLSCENHVLQRMKMKAKIFQIFRFL